MRQIRLLFVLTSAIRGGVEEVVLGLVQRLDPGEFTLAVAAPTSLLDAFAPDLRGVRVDTLALRADTWMCAGDARRLGGYIRRLRPDVVNSHLFRSTAVAAPVARALGVPAVIETYHGREGWRQGALRGSFVLDRLVGRCVDRVIAVSEAAGDFLIHGKGYPARKIVVVPNGRDLSAFTPGRDRQAVRKELGLDDAVPVVGVVGRLEAQKGHRHLIEAWPEITQALPDARLLIIGDGRLRPDLQAQATALGVGPSVIFTGFRTDVPRLLDAVDVVVLPSLYEGMPLTAIEAAAMGRAIVATAVDGTPEVVQDRATGLLVPPGEPAPLARGLLTLLGDLDAAHRMGATARAVALERFDLARQVERTAQVYRSALQGRR